jgi:hypothetical protein
LSAGAVMLDRRILLNMMGEVVIRRVVMFGLIWREGENKVRKVTDVSE